MDINKLFSIFILLGLTGCLFSTEEHMDSRDIRIFYQTPAWNLVRAIEKDDIKLIELLIKQDTSLLNYQVPDYGITPLRRAVGGRHYGAAKLLLELGANPNLKTGVGKTAIYDAIADGWYADYPEEDTSMLRLLLEYGADPNLIYISPIPNTGGYMDAIEDSISPLIYAIEFSWNAEKIKLLIDYGADINYKTPRGKTAAISALIMENIEIAHLLIVEKRVDISAPYYNYNLASFENELDTLHPKYPVGLLIYMIYDIPSKNYRLKRDVIQRFEDEGFNYDECKIDLPQGIISSIRKKHPDDFEEYLQKY